MTDNQISLTVRGLRKATFRLESYLSRRKPDQAQND